MRLKNNIFLTISLTLILVFSLAAAAAADQLTLVSGETLNGEILNDSFRLQTVYAELNIASDYLVRIESAAEGAFKLQAAENNKFTGELLTAIQFAVNGSRRTVEPEALASAYFSKRATFNSKQQASITLSNDDFFFATMVEDAISINSSLGSAINLNFSQITAIEYLAAEDSYLISRRNGDQLKAKLAQKKLIVWPAAAEIIELNLDYLKQIKLD